MCVKLITLVCRYEGNVWKINGCKSVYAFCKTPLGETICLSNC